MPLKQEQIYFASWKQSFYAKCTFPSGFDKKKHAFPTGYVNKYLLRWHLTNNYFSYYSMALMLHLLHFWLFVITWLRVLLPLIDCVPQNPPTKRMLRFLLKCQCAISDSISTVEGVHIWLSAHCQDIEFCQQSAALIPQ